MRENLRLLLKFKKTIMLFVKVLIVLSVTAGFIEIWTSNYVESIFSNKGNYVVILSYVLLFIVFQFLDQQLEIILIGGNGSHPDIKMGHGL